MLGGCDSRPVTHVLTTVAAAVLALLLTAAGPSCAAAAAAAGGVLKIARRTAVFEQHKGGYRTYRIPSLIGTPDGSGVLAFAEGRSPIGRPPVGNSSVCYGQLASLFDWQCYEKDIVLRRSSDGGRTFGAVQTVAASNSSFLYTNPLPLRTGSHVLWLAYVRCPIPPGAPSGRSVFINCTQIVRSSTNDGRSWTSERVLSGSYPMHDGGVGGGLVLRGSGKLLFSRNGYGVLQSNDQGLHWDFGQPLPHRGESQPVQLANGSVIMQMRDKGGKYLYVWCRSDDQGESFHECFARDTPLVPDCPTSILALQEGKLLLFSHPNSHVEPRPRGRQNMTISASSDDGRSFQDALQVWAGPAAYSSLAELGGAAATSGGQHQEVGLLFEKSTDGKEPIDFEMVELVVITVRTPTNLRLPAPHARPPADAASVTSSDDDENRV